MSHPDDKLAIIDLWFRLRDGMLERALPADSTALRPPSLREACYAYALAERVASVMTSGETIEAFVNGLELGAMAALRKAWDFREVE